jgi:hypothetical protein
LYRCCGERTSTSATYQKKLLQQYERLRRRAEEMSFSGNWQHKMLDGYIEAAR